MYSVQSLEMLVRPLNKSEQILLNSANCDLLEKLQPEMKENIFYPKNEKYKK